ncbi:CDP-alcohol phosphatidyltransferase family protein [Microlunatus sp. Gsoil 973]|uniref:CDP-alcohol phosphatidyltransferase family protein n=1 Tax=Microlunatus sp. Gsoil 973 TaxID=2672569 RepID=UPI0012B4A4A2|nr:CDP-alcohol phosphatidyltransferase family protein [Microlunatus sp. Gsoil 973]QGN34638.1 hypothetical protein GJV80_19410 [Microlunatus sp. Gsoil 973]
MSESSARSSSPVDAARAIRGFSASAEAVVLGDADPELRATLREVCGGAEIGRVLTLADLAVRAAGGTGPFVLAAAGLDLDLPATLDLLDSPGDRTAALLADPRNIEAPHRQSYGLDRATLARVGTAGIIESTGATGHSVGNPNRVVIGLLRIRSVDRRRAAEIWAAAADQLDSADATLDLFDLALMALVRGGLGVGEQPLGYYRWSRNGAALAGLGATAWDQRLRSASRLGDGAYSAAVVRRLSRIGTRRALRTPLTPNLITAISLGVGVAAGLLIFTGHPIAWVVAAVLLQVALIIDCVDGEVARFTRRYSAFGGWLDGIGDRIKEYLVFAAVGAVAVRDHHPYGWLLAIIALVVVTARHLEDYAYTDRQAAGRVAGPAPVSVTRPDDGSPDGTRTALPAPPTRSARITFWAKKIAHVPIAERYLVLSVTLLTLQPVWVLAAAVAVSGFALVWVVGGRLLRALRQHRAYRTPSLDHQLDLGLLSMLAGRVRFPFLPGTVILIILWLGLIASICYDAPTIAWAWAAASVIVAGCTLGPPVTDRFGWLALPLVWIAESAVISSLLAARIDGALVFVAVAAIAYRRYELIYSIRLRGTTGPRSLLGADGRILAIGVLFTVRALTDNPGFITWGLAAVAIETLGEAVLGTAVRWRRPARIRRTLTREQRHSEAGS